MKVIIPGSRHKIEIKITKKGKKLWLKFPFNKPLLDEVKTSFSNPKWHGFEDTPIKQWSVSDDLRTNWCLDFLQGKNPYKQYVKELKPVKTRFPLFDHQEIMVAHFLMNKRCLLSAEMGIGKTLAVIAAMEISEKTNWLYVAPRSALYSVELEFEKWGAKTYPTFKTYGSLKKLVADGCPDYDGVIFDECHELKTPTAQRSIAAKYIADNIRDKYVWLMSGSPAPKSPADWWHQCEVACPGYLREGNIFRFKERLSISKEAENEITGGVYNQHVSWRDDETKCKACGELKEHPNHDSINMVEEWYHVYQESVNEVALLYKRMKGLVVVQFKKDCIDLPEKQYVTLKCKPSQDLLNTANLIVNTAPSVIKALTLLRELSDGFQYDKKTTGRIVCPACDGKKVIKVPEEQACPACSGTGYTAKIERSTVFVDCPKDDILRDLIHQHEEVGRIIVYAGFHGSIDRIVKNMPKYWEYIRADGRGWESSIGGSPKELLKVFQDRQDLFPRLAFIGAPGAAGTGLTLTASPSIVYYSNTFNAKDRIQSEDRIHRPGCRGAMIYDIVNLPSDEYVLENLRKKRKLQSISQGELQNVFTDKK